MLGAGVIAACSGVAQPLYGAPWDAGLVPEAGLDAGGDASDASSACFSPDQNLDTAYAPGATGCPCSGTELDACVADSSGRLVALTCAFGSWQAVEDGACLGG
jgi:hypothetical protein